MATATSTLRTQPLPPRFGLEIGGMDLRQPLDDATWARIWEAFNVAGDGPTA